MENNTIIKIEQLEKSFGALHVLKGINLEIHQGEVVCIIGASGSGKSTLLRCINLLEEADSGHIWFDGQDLMDLSVNLNALRQKIGMVFQGFNLLARTTALENVELPLLYRGLPKHERRDLARAALDRVGLLEWEDHTPAALSGGQQQRVAIARAIVTKPSLLLADEPTGSLDSARSVEIMELLTDLNRSDNITVVLVTHEPDMAQYASRVVRFRDGRIESDTREVAP